MASNTTSVLRRRNKSHETKREKLLSGSKQKESSTAAQEAKDITSSLRRTKIMMQQELNRISNVSESIDNDGKVLKMTKDEHLGLKGGIKGAKGSLGRLKLKEKEDEIVFWASVGFFYAVVLYVLWTRIRIPFLMW